MSYREVIRDNIKVMRLGAVVAAIAVIIVPELIIGVSLPTLYRLTTGAIGQADPPPLFSLIVLALPFLPLVAAALSIYARMVLNAALYQSLLSIDENLEKLAKRP